MSSEAAVFFRLNRVPVCSEAELLIFIMTAKCKFTGEEKLLIISPHRKENLRGCRDFNLGEPERIYNIFPDFQLRLKMLIMLYIPEALRHTRMPGLQPGWTRKDIQHLPGFSFTFQNADYVLYPRSAQAYADAGTSTWVNQKGYTTFAWIFICVLNADYVIYPRSAQAYADAGTSTWVNQKGYTTFA